MNTISRRQMLASCLGLAACGSGLHSGAANGATRSERPTMSDFLRAARDAVLNFEKTGDVDRLRQAGNQLERIDLMPLQEVDQRLAARRQTATAWMNLLAHVDAARDPAFNPDEPGAMRVTPRSPPGRPPYAPGIAPSDIHEPEIRQAYEQDIAKNKERLRRSEHHWALEAVDIEVTEGAQRFLRRWYTRSPIDQQELQQIIDTASLKPSRATALMAR